MKFRKIIVSTLTLLMVIAMLPSVAFAAEVDLNETANSMLYDTSNPDVGIELFPEKLSVSPRYNTTSASQSGRFYLKSDNSTLGEFKATGEFTYDGKICNVINCKTSIWGVVDGWRVSVSESEKQVSPTLAKAVAVFSLYKESFWGDSLSSSATVTVSCNQKGTTSTEFNGDEAV